MSDSAQDFLDEAGTGESYEAIKFKEIGDHVVGTLMSNPQTVVRPNLNDGQPEKQLPINLETSDGPRTLWVRKGFLAGAIKEARDAVGATTLLKDGKLTVQMTELRDTGKPQPAKVFRAKYEPPAGAPASVTDIFGDAETVSA